jgi:hypothetical protein
MLILGVELEPALSGLRRYAADDHLAILNESRVDRRAHPVHRRITRIRVGIDAVHHGLRVEVAVAGIEPQPIFLDRAPPETLCTCFHFRRLRQVPDSAP